MRPIVADLLQGRELYREVVLRRIQEARESVWISTANVKAMFVEQDGEHRSVLELFATLAERGVELRLLHAELPSRPFREAFDRQAKLVRGGLQLKICPRGSISGARTSPGLGLGRRAITSATSSWALSRRTST
jgi:hypothetical protein